MTSDDPLLSLHASLTARARAAQLQRRQLLDELEYETDDFVVIPSPAPSPPPTTKEPVIASSLRTDLPPAKRARLAKYRNYVPEEETIRNDYSQHYVDSGEWPQNWVLGAEPENRFEE
jgi:mRNA (2'-O-methyladenosine-N6-)-methyltransferase